jgi:serine/threonine protein kinase
MSHSHEKKIKIFTLSPTHILTLSSRNLTVLKKNPPIYPPFPLTTKSEVSPREEGPMSSPDSPMIHQPLLFADSIPIPIPSPHLIDIGHCPSSPSLDLSSYSFVKNLSRGNFAIVDLYKDRITGEEIAVKSSSNSSLLDREYSILKHLKHPSVIEFLGLCQTAPSAPYRLATVYLNGSSLADVLNSVEPPDWFQKSTAKAIIITGIALGMRHLHRQGIVHRDLNPNNVLIEEDSHYPKICDFNLSTTIESDVQSLTAVGTVQYMAPEAYRANESGDAFKIDVFGFGLMLYEIVVGVKVFRGNLSTFQTMKKAVMGERSHIPPNVPRFLADLVERCWAVEPEKRPTFVEVCEELRKQRFAIAKDCIKEKVEEFVRELEEKERKCERSEIGGQEGIAEGVCDNS